LPLLPEEIKDIEDSEKKKGKARGILKWFKGLDERVFRPWLIHKYSKIKKDRDYNIYMNMKQDVIVEHYDVPSEPEEI